MPLNLTYDFNFFVYSNNYFYIIYCKIHFYIIFFTRSELWDEYLHQQRCNFSVCSVEDSDVAELAAGVQDAAVTSVSHAMAAFAKALKSAHQTKCPGGWAQRCPQLNAINPEDWRQRVSAEIDALQMPLPPHFDIFYKQAYMHGLSKITNFTSVDFPSSK